MELSESDRRFANVFFPDYLEKHENMLKSGRRLVHYTQAGVAMKIISSEEVWLRNTHCMSDYMEVEHGLQCLIEAYDASDGELGIENVLDSIYSGLSDELRELFNGWIPHIRSETYITCLSEHIDDEDILGRLSMWRAYGGSAGVAMVLRNSILENELQDIKAYTAPVCYWTKEELSIKFNNLVKRIHENTEFLKQSPKERLIYSLFFALRIFVLCTKHPGFSEEREWRVFYTPALDQSDIVKYCVEEINGIPQKVYKIPLKNNPDRKIVGLQVDEIIDRIIIGPTAYPSVLFDAFVDLLKRAGVEDAEEKVVISDIPLRT